MSYYNRSYPHPIPICGCYVYLTDRTKHYLPQVQLDSHTTILATTSRTVLQQVFVNPLNEALKEVSYTFPLYDGVSVGGFMCRVAGRNIVGVVKERNQARADYQEAVSKGHTAGLFEQSIDAADVFTTSIGVVPVGEKVLVEITYLGELKNDAETDGARFTIPTSIAPRYGSMTLINTTAPGASASSAMTITVDISLEQGSSIRGIQSPGHPIAVTMGRTSTTVDDDDAFENHLGSATLTLGSTELDKDFVVVVQAKGQDTPRALLEMHPSLPNQRALMATLVPKFNIPNAHPELVFVVDRSGSMGGKMHLVTEASKVLLKSLPVSVKFNICSFGSHHSFLFDKSKTYDATSLQIAIKHVERFAADYGGTEMLGPVQEVLKRRYKDLSLEVILLTDGQIWNQEALFDTINEASQQKARFFTLGIGSAASSSLVEGIARAGRGFAQWVNDGERIDKRVVRMLKGALTPHIEYKLEVRYARDESVEDDDFEIVESFEKSMKIVSTDDALPRYDGQSTKKKIIPLFTPEAKEEPTNPTKGRYDHLPSLAVPHVLQTPYEIPELYPHSRLTIYLLLGPGSNAATPSAVVLRGKSEHGDLELEIPLQSAGNGTTIHQLAAKKAMQELEEGRGWLTLALAKDGRSLKSQNEGRWDLMIEREAVRLGTTFQVGGKFCSFVAIGQDEQVAKDAEVTQGTHLQDYQMQLMLLEQQNPKRLMMARTQPPQFGVMPGANSLSARQSNSTFAAMHAPGPSFHHAQSLNASPSGSGYPGYVPSAGGALQYNAAPAPTGTFGSAQISPQGQYPQQLQQMQQQHLQQRQYQQQQQLMVSTLDSFTSFPNPLQQPDQSFNLDFSTMENTDVLQNFDFDSFLKTSSHDTLNFNVDSCADQSLSQRPLMASSLMACMASPPPPPPAAASVAPPPPPARGPAAPESLTRTSTCLQSSASGSRKHSVMTGGAGPASKLLRRARMSPSSGSAFTGGGRVSYRDSQVTRKAAAEAEDDEVMDEAGKASDPYEIASRIEQLPPLEKMQHLIGLQTFSGSWVMNEELLAVISHAAQTDMHSETSVIGMVKKSCSLSLDGDVLNRMDSEDYATALVITWLEVVTSDEEDVWQMVVAKAKGWLEGQVGGSEVVEKLVDGCKGLWKV